MTKSEAPEVQFAACHRYAGIADRKARRVVDLIRGRKANHALADLEHDRHRAAPLIRRVLASAVANALQNPAVRANRLVVSQAFVNGGPLLQGRLRFRPGPMGRAMPFRRRTCHIHVKVTDPEVTAEELRAAARQMAESATEDSGDDAETAVESTASEERAAKAGKKPAKKPTAKKAAAKKPATKKAQKKPSKEPPAGEARSAPDERGD
jgi:large subunit ribosomal protein L22